jgi:Ca-activated chloride channel family protein
VVDDGLKYGQASADFKFAAAVAAFGMVLRGSEHRGGATLGGVIELAGEARGDDPGGRRAEFIELARRARAILESR